MIQSVCVFCGSAPGARASYARAAEDMGRALAKRGLTPGPERPIAALAIGGVAAAKNPEGAGKKQSHPHSGTGPEAPELTADALVREIRSSDTARLTGALVGAHGIAGGAEVVQPRIHEGGDGGGGLAVHDLFDRALRRLLQLELARISP